jgi:glycerol uptake facilitator-like aquaporin
MRAHRLQIPLHRIPILVAEVGFIASTRSSKTMPELRDSEEKTTPMPSIGNAGQEARIINLKETSNAFAGRLGGNQAFVLDDQNEETLRNLLKTTPDATPILSWRVNLNLRQLSDHDLWKQAAIEGFGTFLLVWMAGMAAVGLQTFSHGTALGPITPAIFGGLINLVQIPLFIYALGPVSGGHVNPLITMITFTCRLSTLSRAILYIVAQSVGAVVSSFLLRASVGKELVGLAIPGCSFDTDEVKPIQAFVIETMTSLTLAFLAVGIGLDPRQRDVFGPALAPFLLGCVLCYTTFISSILKSGYTGACTFDFRVVER